LNPRKKVKELEEKEKRATEEKESIKKKNANKKRKLEKQKAIIERKKKEEEARKKEEEAIKKVKTDPEIKAQLQESRTKIVRELYETEKSYVRFLELIIRKYINPLSTLASINPATAPASIEQIKTIFMNSLTIFNFNSMFLEALENRIRNWDENTILSDLFNQMNEFFRIYSVYVNLYNMSTLAIKQLESKPTWTNFCWTVETDKECKLLNLESMLILPVQRMPRYELLLKSILKFTWEEHPDYIKLRDVVRNIVETIEKINEKKREADRAFRLYEIQMNLHGKFEPIVASGRIVLKDGEIQRISKGKVQPGFLVLCNDLIIVAKPKFKDALSWNYKERYSLHDIIIERVEENAPKKN